MATKSIFKPVLIQDHKSAAQLASALEIAKEKKSREVSVSLPVSDANHEEIRAMFHCIRKEGET